MSNTQGGHHNLCNKAKKALWTNPERLLLALSHLDGNDVGRLRPLGAVFDAEFDLLAFFKLAKAFGLYRRIVDEDVVAILTRDKAIAFGTVKPLDGAGNALAHSRILLPFVDL